jgi:hypothetical protein
MTLLRYLTEIDQHPRRFWRNTAGVSHYDAFKAKIATNQLPAPRRVSQKMPSKNRRG